MIAELTPEGNYLWVTNIASYRVPVNRGQELIFFHQYMISR